MRSSLYDSYMLHLLAHDEKKKDLLAQTQSEYVREKEVSGDLQVIIST